MRKYQTPVLAMLIVIVTVFSGVLHGRLSGRWGSGLRIKDAAEALAKVPADFGDWQLQYSKPLDASTLTMLECAGYLNQSYINRRTGETVNLAVILGPAGPVSVHIPEVCYSSVNYASQGERRRTPIITETNRSNELWSVALRSQDVNAEGLRVYYGWNRGEGWSAPKEPRVSMAGSPYLYKLQLACSVPPGADPAEKDTGMKFLEAFIPHLDDYLVQP